MHNGNSEKTSEKSVRPNFLSWFYDFCFVIFAILSLPFFLKRLKQAENPKQLISERWSNFSDSWKTRFAGKQVIWIHAVSVGEVMATQRLIDELLSRGSEEGHIVLTTVTPTGQQIAKQMENERVSVCYFPFDIRFVVERFFRALHPVLVILVETEIWPNLLNVARYHSVPVGIVNARLSPRSLKGYSRFGFVFKHLFESLSFVLAQGDEDRKRFIELGLDEKRVCVVGNMKFDNVPLKSQEADMHSKLRAEWKVGAQDLLWVVGSTHPGEEELILDAFCKLRNQYARLRMILAPRHIERVPAIREILSKFQLTHGLSSERFGSGEWDVLVLNQMGILKDLYAMADVVFVGGSLVKKGGQNPIEPASVKQAVLHGPHTFNFKVIYKILDQEEGALCVHDVPQLVKALALLLDDSDQRKKRGQKAFEIVERSQGATQRTVSWILPYLKQGTYERIHDAEVDSKLFS